MVCMAQAACLVAQYALEIRTNENLQALDERCRLPF